MKLNWGIEYTPFCCPNGNPHSNIPGQRAKRAYITMQPLLQIAIVNVLIHKHPEWTLVPTEKLGNCHLIFISKYDDTVMWAHGCTFEHLLRNSLLDPPSSYALLSLWLQLLP